MYRVTCEGIRIVNSPRFRLSIGSYASSSSEEAFLLWECICWISLHYVLTYSNKGLRPMQAKLQQQQFCYSPPRFIRGSAYVSKHLQRALEMTAQRGWIEKVRGGETFLCR